MQKFHKGDLVKIADDLGELMRHFKSGTEAIVDYSYNDRYGGCDTKSYSLTFRNGTTCSWYEESQLELIEKNRIDLLKQWKEEAEKERAKKSDLDWIFNNAEEHMKNPIGASIEALGACLGIDNLWGSSGEGFVYYQNALLIADLSRPFLEKHDKEGWLSFCEKTKREN